MKGDPLACSIDGQSVDVRRVGQRVLNYGQGVGALRPQRYRLSVRRGAFLAAVAPAFEEFRKWAAGERSRPVGPNKALAPLETYWALGCPDLETLLSQHLNVLVALLEVWMYEDLFGALFPWQEEAPNSIDYFIDWIDKIAVEDDIVVIDGPCYR